MQYIFTCILPAGSRILSVCMGEPRPWLAPDTVLAVRSSMAWDGTSAGNDMDCEPGTEGGKPGTCDGASDTTGYGKPSTRDSKPGTRDGAPGMYGKSGTGDGKPGTGDGEPEPGTRNQGAPDTTDGRARDGTSAGNNMDREPAWHRRRQVWHP